MKAPSHPQEAARLAALHSYEILDTDRESDFDEIVALASAICEAPISVVNLIDEDRQWFKAEVGLGVRETPIDSSLCAHAILEDGFVEIPDTLADPRMQDNPLCLGNPGLRFYAGAQLLTPDNLPLGTLCVLDWKPRRLTDFQRNALRVLARQVMTQLNLRAALSRQKLLIKEIDHRVKNSLQSITSLVRLQQRAVDDEGTKEFLGEVEMRIMRVALIHEQLYRAGVGNEVDLAPYLAGLRDLLQETLPHDVKLDFTVPRMALDSHRAQALGIIISEFVTNALKHGLASGSTGHVGVTLTHDVASKCLNLLCQDFGSSGPAQSEEPKGIGLRLMQASATQFGGTLTVGSDERGFHLQAMLPLG